MLYNVFFWVSFLQIETEKIFSNITAIETLHTKFWKEKLSNVVKKARMEKKIPSAVDLVEAFEGVCTHGKNKQNIVNLYL